MMRCTFLCTCLHPQLVRKEVTFQCKTSFDWLLPSLIGDQWSVQWRARVRFPTQAIFDLLHYIKTTKETHLYPIIIAIDFTCLCSQWMPIEPWNSLLLETLITFVSGCANISSICPSKLERAGIHPWGFMSRCCSIFGPIFVDKSELMFPD